jgi:hypothetical protein
MKLKTQEPKLKYAHPKYERHLLITNVEIKPTYLGNVDMFQCAAYGLVSRASHVLGHCRNQSCHPCIQGKRKQGPSHLVKYYSNGKQMP